MPEQMLLNWPFFAFVCDEDDPVNSIPLLPYPTMDKIYWGLTPQCFNRSVLVTLGTRNDTVAVKMMKKTWPNLVTYGTNRLIKKNEDYDHFYKYEIGANRSGIETLFREHIHEKVTVSF
uniref:Glycosyltransferase family 92 protein n=1 Tax=Caenorhabditis japonica TaxID=281687 RepID=A0A8R1I359_CAEJA